MNGSARALAIRLPPIRLLAIRLLPVAWMALIFGLSSLQSPRLVAEPTVDLVLKKVGHVALYAVLAFLVAAVVDTTRWSRWAVRIGVAATLAFAISDEVHQRFTPTRWSSWVDVLIDLGGAAFGLWLFVARRRGRAPPLPAGQSTSGHAEKRPMPIRRSNPDARRSTSASAAAASKRVNRRPS